MVLSCYFELNLACMFSNASCIELCCPGKLYVLLRWKVCFYILLTCTLPKCVFFLVIKIWNGDFDGWCINNNNKTLYLTSILQKKITKGRVYCLRQFLPPNPYGCLSSERVSWKEKEKGSMHLFKIPYNTCRKIWNYNILYISIAMLLNRIISAGNNKHHLIFKVYQIFYILNFNHQKIKTNNTNNYCWSHV